MKKAPAAMKAKAMKAAMKAKKGGSGRLTATGAYSLVAEKTGLKSKQVKEVAEAVVALAATQLKKSGQFKFAGALNMKLKKKPAPQTVRALPMKKFKELVN